MNPLHVIGGLSLAANLTLGWLWLEAREDLAAEIERCNADKLSAIAEAERITRTTQERAFGERIAQLERIADQRENARRIAETAARDAQEAVEGTQRRIDRLMQEARNAPPADPVACLNAAVPDAALPGM